MNRIPHPTEPGPIAASEPLHGLAEHARALPRVADYNQLPFVFSNDESAASYDLAQSRAEGSEYVAAGNRTAVIVGEGSLMAALPMISEDTVIMLDRSPAMCAYMGRYVKTLREAGGIDEWADRMGFYRGNGHAIRKIRMQAAEWYDEGYEHPAHSDEAFAEARELARRKAAIPWRADLGSKSDMKRLGEVLEAHDAHVTMLNITNAVAGYFRDVRRARHYARRLGRLPVLENAPILAASYDTKPPRAPHGYNMAYSIGPFTGLEDLARRGGDPASE